MDGSARDHVNALDRGLAYGDGVFRTMRAASGAILFWPEHYARLERDCRALGIACPDELDLRADIEHILRAEPDCVVKVIVTRGAGGRGYAPPVPAKPTRVAASFPLPVAPPGCDEHGVRVRWCATRLSDQPALAGVKHLNRLENVLARREWNDPGIAEGLMRDPAGRVIEATMSNVFILESNRLVTPALDRCGVDGVQRSRLIGLARRICDGCDIDAISPERLLAADQVYLVNSVIGAWWVSALETRSWKRAEITPRLVATLQTNDG